MNKKHLSIIVVLLITSFMVAACGNGRDLSTPSTTIVGHWGYFGESRSDPLYEMYFGEFDEDGIAPCFYVDDEFNTNDVCRIISESVDTLIIGYTSEEEPDGLTDSFWPAKDGQSLKWNNDELQYIDSKTEP